MIETFFFSPKTYDTWDGWPTLQEFMSLRNVGRSLFGVGGDPDEQILMGAADRLFLEFVLVKHQWVHLVEFGTWTGLTSLYLGVSAALKGQSFITYDFKDYRREEVKDTWHPVMEFELVNLLGVEPEEDNRPVSDVPEDWQPVLSVVERVSRPNTLLLVDNGNKKAETRLYCPHLQPESGFLIHDWDVEVGIEDIRETVEQNNFQMAYNDVAEMLGSHLRFFVREPL